MARTKQTARVSTGGRVTGEKPPSEGSEGDESDEEESEEEESEEEESEEEESKETKEKPKPQEVEKGDEELEVLDLTGDISGDEQLQVTLRSPKYILKYECGREPYRKKEGKKGSHCGERCQCWMAVVLLDGHCGKGC